MTQCGLPLYIIYIYVSFRVVWILSMNLLCMSNRHQYASENPNHYVRQQQAGFSTNTLIYGLFKLDIY